MTSDDKFHAALASGYAFLLTVTGWSYVISSRRSLGWLHALLMLGITCIGGYFTFHILYGHTLLYGGGRSDNPVKWLDGVLGLLWFALAVITGICGLGVLTHVLHKKRLN